MAHSKPSKTHTENSSTASALATIDPLQYSPLLEGEDEASFNLLRENIIEAISPSSFIEDLLVKDCVEIAWETQRLRRLKVKYLQSSAPEGLRKILSRLVDMFELNDLITKWSRGEGPAIARVNDLLKAAGLDKEAIVAQTLGIKLQEYQTIEVLITKGEARLQNLLREIDRRRNEEARRLQIQRQLHRARPIPVPPDNEWEAAE